MRHLVAVGVVLVALSGIAAEDNRAMRQREVLQLQLVDGGTLPAATQGGIIYDTLLQQMRLSDGGIWAPVVSGGISATSETQYVFATFTAAQSTNLGVGNHLMFDSVIQSAGSLITLDTTTAYSALDNVASLGRFTLTAGYTYVLRYSCPLVTWGGNTDNLYMGWVNVDTGLSIGGVDAMNPSTGGASGTSSHSGNLLVFTPSVNTRVEVRIHITVTGSLTSFGGTVATPDGGTLLRHPLVLVNVL